MDNCIHCLHLSKDCTCAKNNPCSKEKSDSIKYTGPNLSCTNIDTNDNMTLVVQKLNDSICGISPTTSTSTTAGSTSTTTSTTTIAILEFNFTDRTVWNNGQSNVTSNTSFGDQALKVTTAGFNTAYGVQVLAANVGGTRNSAFGYQALLSNLGGNDNVAIGYQTAFANTSGLSNTALGGSALFNNSTGNQNTAVGNGALFATTTTAGNTALGYRAGRFILDSINPNSTPVNSVFLGNMSMANADGETNQIVIGYNAIGLGSNTAQIGNSSITKFGFYGRAIMHTNPITGLGTENLLVRDASTGEIKQIPIPPDDNTDPNAIHTTGDEMIISGIKTILADDVTRLSINNSSPDNNFGAIDISNTNFSPAIKINNSGTASGVSITNTGSTGGMSIINNNTTSTFSYALSISLNAATTGTGLKIFSSSTTAAAAEITSNDAGKGIVLNNGSTIGLDITNGNSTALATAIKITNSGTNTSGIVINNSGGGPNRFMSFQNNGTEGSYIDANGNFVLKSVKLTALNTAPATATSAGTTGDIRFTTGFIYVCVATNTWVRAALTTF